MLAHTLFPLSAFKARQQQLLSNMPADSVAILFAAKEVTRSNDTEFLFCQDKHFYYLSGFNEPDAVMVLTASKTILFSLAKDALQEVWHGKRVGQEKAIAEYGFDESYPLAELDEKLPELIENSHAIYYCQGQNSEHDQNIQKWLNKVKAKSRLGIKAPTLLHDLAPLIAEQRLIKSDAELEIMRKANVISGNAHQRAMEKTAVGKFEYQIEAEILHEFARNGARVPAYNSIVAGGDNANILHYTNNTDLLAENELLLIDAGAELAGYAADITRTFPINGQFTAEQKALYQLVLDAQHLAINAIKPGVSFAELNKMVCDYFTQALFDLGILTGDIKQLITDNACKKYFIHGLGHWLGLDVHDVGDYQSDDKRQQLRPFEPGMVMTIEPGLYIPSDDDNVDQKWRGIAIRIEDNILVTATGFENLTVNAPKEIAEIEQLMAKAKNA